jgi:hypothetical protein
MRDNHLDVTMFTDNKDEFIPNVLPSYEKFNGEFLFTSTKSSSNSSSRLPIVSNEETQTNNDFSGDVALLNTTLEHYGILPKKPKSVKSVSVTTKTKVKQEVNDDDDNFETPLNCVTPNKKKTKKKDSAAKPSTHKKSR